jgi:hypothetical protein
MKKGVGTFSVPFRENPPTPPRTPEYHKSFLYIMPVKPVFHPPEAAKPFHSLPLREVYVHIRIPINILYVHYCQA